MQCELLSESGISRGNADISVSFDGWIRTVDSYSGNDILWLNTNGVIPPEAVIPKVGEKRANPFTERKRFDTTDFSQPVCEVESEYDEAAFSRKDVADVEMS